VQVDGADYRNVLISRVKEERTSHDSTPRTPRTTQPIWGSMLLLDKAVETELVSLGFSPKASLSVMAVEMAYSQTQFIDPLGGNLGKQRILRTSNLVPVGPSC